MMSTVPLTLEQIVEETEIDRRIEEIQTGKVQGIPAEEVFEKAKRILGR
jgi:Putative addiction module component